MKRFIFLLFILFFQQSFAVAEETDCSVFICDDYEYVLLHDGTAEITKYSGKENDLFIPNTLDGISVTSIGDSAFYWCTFLNNISIPDSVTNIGDNAFSNCWNVQNITFSDNVTHIGCNAFAWCDFLRLHAIPNSVTYIGDFAFTGCNALTTITIPDNVVEMGINPFYRCKELLSINVSKNNSSFSVIDGSLVHTPSMRLISYPCSKDDTSFIIPTGIFEVGGYAFSYNQYLERVTVSDTVSYIDDCAFSMCDSLTSISIPNSVINVGTNPFSGCLKLTDIQIPDDHSVLFVNDGVLIYKPEMKLVCYPCSKTNSSYTIPNGIKKIGNESFYLCDNLLDITIPNTVTYIGDNAFMLSKTISSIIIPDSVTYIGKNAFYWCARLTKIYIPNTVKFIGDSAFYNCPRLTISAIQNSYAEQYCDTNNLNYSLHASFPIVTFGRYEQDNKKENGAEKIEWIVLRVQDGKCLLLSKYCLDVKAYNTTSNSITWKNCTLRKWLNEDFFKVSFTDDEKSAILLTEVKNSRSQSHLKNVSGGDNTQDRIFLLSYDEAFNLYFSKKTDRQCVPTAFAIANGISTDKNNNTSWWLRTPGFSRYEADMVWHDGDITGVGGQTFSRIGVRPALWLNMDLDIQFQGKDEILKVLNSN